MFRRERCGGQGYLSVNRFGELIGFAHAGMTAEGDNRWAPGGFKLDALQSFRFVCCPVRVY
jgi:hypothetical protein